VCVQVCMYLFFRTTDLDEMRCDFLNCRFLDVFSCLAHLVIAYA